MKRSPTVFSATELMNWHIKEEYEPFKFRPARPCEINLGIRFRIKVAWKVFIGKYDAVNWGSNSGELKNNQVNYQDVTNPEFKNL